MRHRVERAKSGVPPLPVAIGCDLIVKANNDFGVAPSIWQERFPVPQDNRPAPWCRAGRSNWQDSKFFLTQIQALRQHDYQVHLITI
jgi:hypothetical protein